MVGGYVRFLNLGIIGTLLVLVLTGCGEGAPPSARRVTADDDPTNISSRVRIVGTWSTPTKLATESATVDGTDLLHGPDLVNDGRGNTLASWRFQSGLDIQTGLYAQGHNTAKLYIPPRPWAVTDPSAVGDVAADLTNGSAFDFAVNRFSGNIYATWRQGADIMARRYEPGAWEPTVSNLGAGSWSLVVNAIDDQSALVIGQIDEATGKTTLKIARLENPRLATASWALQSAALVRDATDVSLARPVMFQAGKSATGTTLPSTLALAWTETDVNGVLGLWAVEFVADAWGTPVKVSATSDTINVIANPQWLLDNTNKRAQLMYFAGESASNGALYLAAYNNTTWEAPALFDSAQRNTRKASSDFSVSFEDSGKAVVAWREETVVGTIGVNAIYARTYTPGAANKGWNTVRRASALGRLADAANGAIASIVHSPQIKLNASNVMALTWVEDTLMSSEVLVAYADFAANPIWPITPPLAADLVALYNTRGVKAERPQIAVNDSNGLVVVWRQATMTATNTEYVLLASVKGTQQGQAVVVPVNGNGGNPPVTPPSTTLPPGHATLTTGCVKCHSAAPAAGGVPATAKPANHISSKDTCELCHAVIKWKPVVKVDHAAVLGTCVSCHNNVTATGKPATHIAATDKCGACHSSAVWKPNLKVDHREVMGDCVTCHTDPAATVKRGKPTTHINATDTCHACHTAPAGTSGIPTWLPVMVDHAQTVGTCVSCHSGALGSIRGKPATHLPTSNQCAMCHKVTAFAPILGFDHTQTTAACSTCHSGTITGVSGKPANHVNTTEECSVCHTTTAWRPTLAGGGSGAINGTWGEPINVVTVSAKSNAITLVQGPELAWGENGTGFVSLRKNTGFNYVTGKFAVGEDIVQRFDSATQAWTVKSPVPAAQSKAADFAQIKAYGTQGKAYALWAYGADLHFNTFSGSTWSTPEQMGASSPENYHLLVTPSGAAVVVWVEGGDLVAKRYTPASGNTPASWTSAQTLTVADPYFMPPSVAMDAEGNVAVAWLHQASATGVEHWKTHMASNSVVDNTWSAIQAGQDVPVGTTPLNLHLVMHGAPGLPLMVVQVSSNVLVKGGELFASASHADGSWGMWENLDYNVNMPDKLVGHASVSYNNAGDVVVLWTEREVMNTEVQFHVFANYYASEIAPSKTVNTWEPPTHVSMAVEAASMSAMEETEPSMRLDDTGHLIVVWLATDGVNSKVLSNHYHKTAPAGSNPGWNGSPELIVNYDVATSGYALSPQVGVSPGGKDIAVWKQVVRQQFGIDYKVWSSVVP